MGWEIMGLVMCERSWGCSAMVSIAWSLGVRVLQIPEEFLYCSALRLEEI